MTTTTKLFLAFLAAVTLYSCTADDGATTSFQKETAVEGNTEFSESMMQRDSISKEGEETDPPKLPTPPIRT